MDKGYAYEKNGTVYYSTRQFKEYGKLSHKNLDDLQFRRALTSRYLVQDEKEDPIGFRSLETEKRRRAILGIPVE